MTFKKFKQFVNYKIDLDKIHRSNDDAYALQVILKLFPEYTYLPFTPFSLNPYTIIHILNDILLNNRKQIVEFGSGISTIVIAQFIKTNKLKTKILSIDNNKDWQSIISQEVEKYNCGMNLTLLHAELEENTRDNYIIDQNKYWYNNEIVETTINSIENIDLVIVDGPSTGTSAYARYPSFFSVQNKLASSYCIFLDDIKRNGERKIIEKWNKTIQGNLQYEKMYATITVGQKFSTKPLSH
ncbi:class I SAM-dependent methyltransferase [Winogradskyella flava]|uniref:Class I SAM-dependent methyltransferase n=1 Tax=Winogradskyella flava TaxID=1884876 RepID=A0A842IXU4_9FLAO|nr:class I SAM-dependent methyltransferase [Winogradskyella flava]MBC2846107.1 class I SAM-dependent methyltransferase [Winogradskyella flava]